jgi:S-formylglutathione hydrolase FrmB
VVWAAPAGAAPLTLVSRTSLSERLQELTFTTQALRAPTRVRVLLPSGYDPGGRRRYPVLLLLHGAFGSYTDWTRSGDAEAITAGLPLIVVMPDGGRGGWYSDWYNGGAFGPPRWETYHLRQLLPWIESHYRAVGARRGRAVAGLSMGGFGSMSYASRHPDLFAAAAAFSGGVDPNTPPGVAEGIVNVTSALDGGAPGDVAGPRATQDVRWRGSGPWDLAENLRPVSVTLRTGNGEPGGPLDSSTTPDAIERIVHVENVSLHERLRRLGIPHLWDDYGPGNHSFPYWSRGLRKTLPRIMAAFGRPARPVRRYTYRSIAPDYSIFGWRVSVRRRALEFSSLTTLRSGFALTGSGSATVTTPARYATGRSYRIVVRDRDGVRRLAKRARGGRLRLRVRLGPANPAQERFTAAGDPTPATRVFRTTVAIVPPR